MRKHVEIVAATERNPIKAGLSTNVEGYHWSSAKAHVSDVHDPLLAADSWLSPQDHKAYREFVIFEDEETDSAIRKATNSGRPFGSESFVDMLEFRLNQVLKPKKPGRPKNKTRECPYFSGESPAPISHGAGDWWHGY